MNKKILAVSLSALLLMVGGFTNSETTGQIVTKQELRESATTKAVENKALTKQLKAEKGVQQGRVYTQNNVAFATIVVNKSVTKENAQKLVTKYENLLKKHHKNLGINVTVTQNSKVIASKSIKYKAPAKKETVQKIATVQQLIDEKVLVYNQNPITQEHVISLDTTKTPQKYKAKTYYITVGNKDVPLVVNPIDKKFLYVVVDSKLISAKNIKLANVKVKK